MAFQASMILAALLCIAVFSGLRERNLRKKAEQEQAETDRLLTKYVANNIDMEKLLSEMKRKYALQQDMAEELKRMQTQSRLLKHDMKNHSMVILSYLEEGRVREAKAYTSEILDNLNKMYTYISVGNALMNYIINHKLSKAKEQGIEIKAEIENLAFAYMDSIDFSSVLNNMLDNAMESAVKSKEKKMEVMISSQKGFDSILVKNSIDTSVLEANPEFLSTKEGEGHGFGMMQIRQITEKYDGMTDIYEEAGFFIVHVVYPCPDTVYPKVID